MINEASLKIIKKYYAELIELFFNTLLCPMNLIP